MYRTHRSLCQLLLYASLLMCGSVAHAAHYTLPLLVSPGMSGGPQGVLRILNGTTESGAVEIYAIDDAGMRSGPVTFTLNASSAVEFTAASLRDCSNARQGLTGCLDPQAGDGRLEIETDLDIVPLAFVRAPDGTLSAMHDTVRGEAGDESGGYTYEVPVFNPSTDMTQVSRLRLINPGDSEAEISIRARDDNGAEATGGDVTLTLPGGGARTLAAQQLEAGDTDLAGALGAGVGKWRLTVSSDRPLEVVNIVASSTGYWNNLSTTAVKGAAPQSIAAFNDRFVDNPVAIETSSGRTTLNVMPGDRFDETSESDGVTETDMGGFGYAAIGPDAGRLTLDYDDAGACRTHLYFSSLTSGWFASQCTARDDPDGEWKGGRWWIEQPDGGGDGAGEVVETTYAVNDSLPGVPSSGVFTPTIHGGGSIRITGNDTTISLDDGAYFELDDGTRYTCTAGEGCAIANGTVTAGTVVGRAAGAGEVDRFPTFRTATAPGNRSYTVGEAIDTLTLPEASGGNGELAYRLSPEVPGLNFNPATRQLTGTPSTAGDYAMTYTATDEDGDTDALRFTIAVSAGTATEGSLGICQVGMTLRRGQSCAYPGTTDEFSVNARGRGSFLGRLAGIRIRIDNQTINGRVYDFAASHQGGGVWRIDRIAGSTEPPTGAGTDTSPSFAAGSGPGNRTYTAGTAIDTLTLPAASGGNGTLSYTLSPEVPGLTFDATARQLSGTPTTAASYNMTYTATDEDGDADSLGFSISVQDVVGVLPHSVCSRTPGVRDVLVGRTGRDHCTSVTADDLAGLESLTLSNLEIAHMQTGDFSGLVNLKRLTLRQLPLTDLPPDIFADVPSLDSVEISYSNIEALPRDLFAGLTQLRTLYLYANRSLTQLPPDLFRNLHSLEYLNLDYLPLTTLPDGLFSERRSLRELSMRGTRLTELNSETFTGLPELRTLLLQASQIATLDPRAFDGLGQLEKLSIGNNNLQTLPAGMFSGLRNLRQLDLSGNPGAPFSLTVELQRLDTSDLTPGPADVRVRVREGAPFQITARVQVVDGTAASSTLAVEAGNIASDPARIEASGTMATHVGLRTVTRAFCSGTFTGVELRAGAPLTLFATSEARWPVARESIPSHVLSVGGPEAGIDASRYFSDPNGGELTYSLEVLPGQPGCGSIGDSADTVASEAPVAAAVAGSSLSLTPNVAGTAYVEVAATDPDGLSAYQQVAVTVLPPTDSDSFDISLVFEGNVGEETRAQARAMAERWMEVVTGDLPDVALTGIFDECRRRPGFTDHRVHGTVDDVLIFVQVAAISGGKGLAWPCSLRDRSRLPYAGYVVLDSEEAAGGGAEYTLLHEMGHVLGFGTIWEELGLLRGLGEGEQPHFIGPLAIAAFNAAGGSDYDGAKVPVSDDLGHWDGYAFGWGATELMVSGGGPHLSAITIQSLADLGYEVDVERADAFELPAEAGVSSNAEGLSSARSAPER